VSRIGIGLSTPSLPFIFPRNRELASARDTYL
jgi:hypothetical protein